MKFLQAMDQFLDEFGHREVHMDILYPTWCEDPEPVYSFIRSYLDADESQSPYRQQERLIKEREVLTRMVDKRSGEEHPGPADPGANISMVLETNPAAYPRAGHNAF